MDTQFDLFDAFMEELFDHHPDQPVADEYKNAFENHVGRIWSLFQYSSMPRKKSDLYIYIRNLQSRLTILAGKLQKITAGKFRHSGHPNSDRLATHALLRDFCSAIEQFISELLDKYPNYVELDLEFPNVCLQHTLYSINEKQPTLQRFLETMGLENLVVEQFCAPLLGLLSADPNGKTKMAQIYIVRRILKEFDKIVSKDPPPLDFYQPLVDRLVAMNLNHPDIIKIITKLFTRMLLKFRSRPVEYQQHMMDFVNKWSIGKHEQPLYFDDGAPALAKMLARWIVSDNGKDSTPPASTAAELAAEELPTRLNTSTAILGLFIYLALETGLLPPFTNKSELVRSAVKAFITRGKSKDDKISFKQLYKDTNEKEIAMASCLKMQRILKQLQKANEDLMKKIQTGNGVKSVI